jgi:uncharacterized membrane protein YbhN (UPF0104 family)
MPKKGDPAGVRVLAAADVDALLSPAECIDVVVNAVGADLSFAGAVLVATGVNLSTMMSITPANLGVYEGSAFIALRASGVPIEQALAASVLLHLSYLVPIAGVGWTLLVAASVGSKRRSRGAQELPGTAHHP